MKRKMILAALAAGLALPGFAQTIIVSQKTGGVEKIVAQQEVAAGTHGVVKYNLCEGIAGITASDYHRCESTLGYMAMNNGSIVIESHHKNFAGFKQLADQKIAIISEVATVNAMIGEKMEYNSKSPNEGLRIFVK